MTQGERVREIRKTLSMTLVEFGEKVGVGKSAISAIENDQRGLTDQMIRSICREFNVNYDWLISEEGDMFSNLPETILDELCIQYDLDDLDRQILNVYLTLDPKIRQAVKDHIRETFGK